MPAVVLGETTVGYTVRVSKRAKRINLRYSQRDGLEVVYPLGISSPAPEELLKEKSSWVLATHERFRSAANSLPPRNYENGEIFHLLGRPYTLQLRSDSAIDRAQVEASDNLLLLIIPDSFPGPDLEARRKAVEAYYRALAGNYLPARVRDLAAAHGFQFARLRVKNQKTRWGSCSSKGNINLNLRLMMTPERAIDYVIVHELCHLRVLSHSPAFWALVESCFPDFRHWRSWFKRHGASMIL
jgi:hypothetical protein